LRFDAAADFTKGGARYRIRTDRPRSDSDRACRVRGRLDESRPRPKRKLRCGGSATVCSPNLSPLRRRFLAPRSSD
jgi:hypothetical protein